MNITPAQTQKLLTGDLVLTQVSFSMMITRMKRIYEKDSSSETLKNCTDEINTFLQKYGGIMSADVATISKL